MNIKDVLDLDAPQKGVWIEYGDTGFVVKVSYVSLEKTREMLERSRRRKWNPISRSMEDTNDQTTFNHIYAKEVILDWRGLTLSVLEQFIPFKIKIEGSIPEEFPCNEENKMLLLEQSISFNQFVTEYANNSSNCSEALRTEQLKNLSNMDGGNSTVQRT